MRNYNVTSRTSRLFVGFTLSLRPNQDPEAVACETMAVLGFGDMPFTVTAC